LNNHTAQAAVASLPLGNIRRVFDVYQFFGQEYYSAMDQDTSDGFSIWLSHDLLHLTDMAYIKIGMSLLKVDDEDEVFQPPKKRQQLDSVVPAVSAKPASTAKALLLTADWLTGHLSKTRRGGQGGGWSRGGGRGGGGLGMGGSRSGSRRHRY